MTPRYASPEQLRGSTLTTAVDVYALGVVLHELLSGVLPYDLTGKSFGEVESIILTAEPRPPSRLTPTAGALTGRSCKLLEYRALLKPDLDAIVLHCLHKSPAERYPSVESLRLDLQRWLDHQPVEAMVPSTWYRAMKFVRRHRRGVATTAAVAGVMSALLVVTLWQVAITRRESTLAQAAKDFVLDALRDADPESSKDAGAAAGPLLDLSAARAKRLLADQPELQAEVFERIAEVDQNLDRYTSAQSLLELALPVRRRLGVQEKTAQTEIELAFNSRRIGDDARARQLLSEIDVGRSVELQAHSRELQGWLAWDGGQSLRAKELWSEALALSQQAFGRNDARNASVLQGLVEADMSLRDYASAKHEAEEEVRLTGDADKVTMTRRIAAQTDLASVHFASGDYIQALPITRATLESCVKALGTAAESCFLMRQQLALMLLREFAHDEAVTLLPALDVEAANTQSPSRQIQARSIALRIAAAGGLIDDRATVLEKSLAISMPAKTRLTARLALAEAAVRSRDPEAAIQQLDLLTVQSEVIPADYAARAAMIRGVAEQALGHNGVALRTLEDAVQAYTAQYGPFHTQTLLCELNVVESLLASGEAEEAGRRTERAVRVLRTRLPADAPLFETISKLRTYRGDGVVFFN